MDAAPNSTGPRGELDEAALRRLFAGARLAIFVGDRAGRVVSGNELAAGLLFRAGLPGAGAALRQVLSPAARGLFDESLSELLRTLEPLEFRTRIDSGQAPVEYAVWLAPIRADGGEVSHLSVWFHDITARAQLRRSMRKTERLNALGLMSGSVAHHYNNLLCSIATSLEYALNMNTMSAMRRALGRTADALSRATHLTQQLLAFAKADYRNQDLADLTETVLYFFDENEALFAQRQTQLELDCQPIPVIPVPRENLLAVVRNLAINAIEASGPRGRVHVVLQQRDADSVVLAITDFGPGIPAEHMERLFEPFFTTRGELGDGSEHRAGMGLAVAYGLVSELQGTIQASNVPGAGARFEVILPIRPPGAGAGHQ